MNGIKALKILVNHLYNTNTPEYMSKFVKPYTDIIFDELKVVELISRVSLSKRQREKFTSEELMQIINVLGDPE